MTYDDDAPSSVPETESAMRRDLRYRLNALAERAGILHLERDMVDASLQALGLDELLVIDEVLSAGLVRYASTAWRLVERVADRLVAGRSSYGPLCIAADRRRWHDEAREEVLDALVYLTLAKITGQREPALGLLTLMMEMGGGS